MDKKMVAMRSAVLTLLLQVLLVGCAGRGVSPQRLDSSEGRVVPISVGRPLECHGYARLSVLSRSETRNVLNTRMPPLSDANRSMSLRQVVEDATKRVVVLPPDFPEHMLMDRRYDTSSRLPGLRMPIRTVGSLFSNLFYVFGRENGKVGFKLVTVCTRRYIQVVPIVDDNYDPRWLDRALDELE